MKYVVVTGGVVSGLGKGISISSLGVLLKSCGLRVTSIKIDPYLNVDAGTMSPFEHGEVFVLEDGGEADLDLGNYERFLDVKLTKDHNITTGKVYRRVVEAERRGDYLGKTVQVIPHVTGAVQSWIERVAHESVDGMEGPPDVCLIEVGGTVGDIESLVFLEALRQFRANKGAENVIFFHVSLVPVLGAVGEQKTKPTQHTVKELRSVGIAPDALICRSGEALEESTKEKLALFCQVPKQNVLAVHDVSNIYHVPLLLLQQGAHSIIQKQLGLHLPHGEPRIGPWRAMAERVDGATTTVQIALVGKYNGLSDSYLSVLKALKHSCIVAGRKLVVDWIDAEALEPATKARDEKVYEDSWKVLRECHGVLVPGGFGDRGVEGKILAVQFARENKRPFLGVCLGMQCAVIEHARNVVGLAGANSAEFKPDAKHQAVVFMPEVDPTKMGGTMRLGGRSTLLRGRPDGKPCLAHQIYGAGAKAVHERHRHRYEVNPKMVEQLQGKGLFFVGVDDSGERMEIVERDASEHPFFFGVQYHPEFTSRPNRPSPPFLGFVLAAAGLLTEGKPVSEFLPEDLKLHATPGARRPGLGAATGGAGAASSSSTSSSSSAAASSSSSGAAAAGLVAGSAGSVAMDGEGASAAGGEDQGPALGSRRGRSRSGDAGKGEEEGAEGEGSSKKRRTDGSAAMSDGK